LKEYCGLSYDNLRTRCEDLQRQAAHSLVDNQRLIDARDRLDREITRFTVIQSYSRKAIKAGSLQDFAQMTVYAVIEAFEVECSAMLMREKGTSSLKVLAALGFENDIRES
jgi:hypothetical protein